MLDSLVRVRRYGEGYVYAICDDRPGMSFLVNLKSGKSDWFDQGQVEFLNGPRKENRSKSNEENTGKSSEKTAGKGQRTKRRR